MGAVEFGGLERIMSEGQMRVGKGLSIRCFENDLDF